MAKITSVTGRSASSCPVQIRFCCARCGKAVSITRYLNFAIEVTLRGHEARDPLSGQRAADMAEGRLASLLNPLLQSEINALKQNKACLMDAPSSAPSVFWPPLRCPACGIINLPDAGCKRRTLMQKLIQWALLGHLVIGGTAAVFALFGSYLYLLDSERLLALHIFLVCLAFAALFLICNGILSKKAYGNPKLMEKAFGTVLNSAVYADMTPYGSGEIHIGSEA